MGQVTYSCGLHQREIAMTHEAYIWRNPYDRDWYSIGIPVTKNSYGALMHVHVDALVCFAGMNLYDIEEHTSIEPMKVTVEISFPED
jgi:hypothetical protein